MSFLLRYSARITRSKVGLKHPRQHLFTVIERRKVVHGIDIKLSSPKRAKCTISLTTKLVSKTLTTTGVYFMWFAISFRNTTVIVELQNVNDNSPSFTQQKYFFIASEVSVMRRTTFMISLGKRKHHAVRSLGCINFGLICYFLNVHLLKNKSWLMWTNVWIGTYVESKVASHLHAPPPSPQEKVVFPS